MEEELDDLFNAFDISSEDAMTKSETLTPQNNITLLDNEKEESETNVVTPGKLLEDYTKLEEEKEKIDIKIFELREKHKEIFDELEKYEEAISKLSEQQNNMRQDLTDSIENAGLTNKSISNDIFKVSYVAATTRQNFDKDKFKKQYPVLYNKFIKLVDVKSYVKITKKIKEG